MIPLFWRLWEARLIVVFFILYSIFWIFLQLGALDNEYLRAIFTNTYGFFALLGGIWGMQISKDWGGMRSFMGKAILFLSIGLLFQELGQVIYAYYIYVRLIEIPYPSIGDIPYFGTIPLYIYAAYLLAKSSGAKVTLSSINKIQAIAIPWVMLAIAWVLFLKGYQFNFTNPIKVFLDFGYPLGQAIYISIAILTFSLSRKLLGGVMKTPVLILIVAFMLQFVSDYIFLYQSNNNTWTVSGINDYIYLVAYFVMTLGILQLKAVLFKLSTKT